MNQALWIPLVVLGLAGEGVLVAAMVLVRLKGNRTDFAEGQESQGPYCLITLLALPSLA